MNKDLTDITLVLDRSGSMESIKDDTIGGVNRFISDQKSAPGSARFTLYQFDDVFECVVRGHWIHSVQLLSRATFIPRGSTALLDAIGRTIDQAGERFCNTPEPERPGKVVIVIVTDGMENASKVFTAALINEKITHQREVYGWEFVFLGANQDAIASASAYGIKAANAMTYAANPVGTSEAFDAVSSNLTAMRCGRKVDMSYEKEQRDKQEEAGA